MADEKVKVSSLVTVAPKTTDKVLITTTDDSGQLQTRNALVSDIRNLAASLEDSEDKAINVKIANEIVKKVTDLASEVDTSFETVNQNFTNVNNAISKNRDNITTANENMTAHEEDTDLHVTAEKQQKWDGYDQSIKDVKEIADNNTTQLKEITNKITFKNENITPLNNWVNTIDSNPPVIGKILNSVTLLADLKGGITTNDTVILQLPSWAYPFRTRSFSIVSCDSDWIYKVGMITITTDGKVLLSGFIANTKLTISVTYQV